MRLFKVNPNVAAYKVFAKDSDFKKIKLLSREIKVLELKTGFPRFRKKKEKVAKIKEKIAQKNEEIITLKESLGKKYDLQAVLAGFKKYRKSFAFDMKSTGEAMKIGLPALTIAIGTFFVVSGLAHLIPMPGLTEAGKNDICYIIAVFPAGIGAFGYLFWKLATRPFHKNVVKMAATPDRTRIDVPM